MTPKQKWQFAFQAIRRSTLAKNGSLFAFKIPKNKLKLMEVHFKELLPEYFKHKDDAKRQENLFTQTWSPHDA